MPNPGALRFNTDSQKLELYDGNQWTEIVASSPDAQTGGARGLFGGGEVASPATFTNIIDYITISTLGDAVDFGDLISQTKSLTACASSTRGLFAGGIAPSNVNTINYVTILSTGNAQDFGDLTDTRRDFAACSNAHGGL